MGELRFGLFGFQIRIQPGFWMVALAMLLLGSRSRRPEEDLPMVGVVLVSILIHELGHAIAIRGAGQEPFIVLHAFGGTTSWLPKSPITRRRALAIAAAGPLAGFLLAGFSTLACVVVARFVPGQWGHAFRAWLLILSRVSGFWSLVNLLPVMPLDGGQIVAHLLGPRHQLAAMRISLIASGTLGLLLLGMGHRIGAAVLAALSVLQFATARRAARLNHSAMLARLQLLLVEAHQALEAGDMDRAESLAEAAIGQATAPAERQKAAEIFAWAALSRGQFEKANKIYPILTTGPLDPLLEGAILEASGDVERAIVCLRQAKLLGDQRPQVAASLVRLLLIAERYGEAALTTIEILNDVTEEEARQVISACRQGGRPIPAAELGMALFEHSRKAEDLGWAIVSYAASDNRGGVERALTIARENSISAVELLSSAAFASGGEPDELKKQIRSIDQSVPTPPCVSST